METQIQQATTPNIMDKAICLSVELRRLGTRRKVAASRVETDADTDMIHVSKEILESDYLDLIKKLDGEIRTYINARCLPSMFRAGVYLLPITMIEEVDHELAEFGAKRLALVASFVAEYESAAASAASRLGSLYDPRDYPSLERVMAAFSIETRYITFGTPGTLKSISPTIYAREVEKAKASVAAAAEEIKQVMRANMADLVDHLSERLQKKPDGSQKIFRDSLIGNVKEFLATFQARNIVDDNDLAVLVARAGELLEGVDSNDLRTNDQMRNYISDGFTAIKTELDTMLIAKPARVIDFADASA